jgi:hypothetical protein
MIAMVILQIAVSIPPIRVFQPYPNMKCPQGYSLWWPDHKEFDNDKYAQCVKWKRDASKITANPSANDVVKKASKHERVPLHREP